tara:strand:+ start:663 stop:1016 length:354 start_codon:yes stop_codon:yes gene_type:complete
MSFEDNEQSLGTKILEITQKRLGDAVNQNIILEANVMILQNKVQKYEDEYSDYETLKTAYEDSQKVYNELTKQYEGQLELYNKVYNQLESEKSKNRELENNINNLQKELEEVNTDVE